MLLINYVILARETHYWRYNTNIQVRKVNRHLLINVIFYIRKELDSVYAQNEKFLTERKVCISLTPYTGKHFFGLLFGRSFLTHVL
jgi:hypothetical protein